MRFDSEQLARHLARGLKSLYVVFGEELLLALEAADRIRAAALEQGYDERRVLFVESGFDWGEVAMVGNSLSLFAPRRVLDLRIPSGKPGKDGSEALQRLAGSLPEDLILLIPPPGFERQHLVSRRCGAWERAGVAGQAAAGKRGRRAQWLTGRPAQQDQRAEVERPEFRVSRVEVILSGAFQEVKKLPLLLPAGTLPFEE